MSKKYDIVVRQKEKMGNFEQKTLQISKMNKQTITHKDIVELFNGFKQNAVNDGLHLQIMIRGENNVQWFTLKGFNTDALQTAEEFLDYFNNTVSVTSKFENFYQLQVTLFTSKILKKGVVIRRNEVNHYKVNHPHLEKKVEKKVNPKVYNKKVKK